MKPTPLLPRNSDAGAPCAFALARAALVAFTSFLAATNATAQAPAGSATLSAPAVADSVSAIRALDAELRREPRDAALWYRRGMIAWALHERGSAPGAPRELMARNYARMADSSLRVASEYGRTRALYPLTYARFLLATGNIATRTLANAQFDRALEIARQGADSFTLSAAALEAGRVHWRRYDSYKYRTMRVGDMDMARSIAEVLQPTAGAEGMLGTLAGGGDAAADMYAAPGKGSLKGVEELLRRNTQPLPGDVAGGIDYERASALFHEAYRVAPTNPRAARAYAMVLADSSRWRELSMFARTHLAQLPWDPQGWMVLGLAQQRLGDSRGAAAAFDSGFAYASPPERARLDRLQRILRPDDSARVSRASEPARQATATLYWRFADPLWSREGNESRVEFLARVTFAELRWTVDELNLRGADTERGDVYIRYGLPELAAAVQPRSTSDGADVVTFWVYHSGLVFSFAGMPTFGTARTPFSDLALAEGMKDAQPVRWDNIAEFQVDSMPVQVARFRGGRDSVDVLVAAAAPYTTIAAASAVKEPVNGYFWLLLGGMTTVRHDSATIAAGAQAPWIARVAPGSYVYRSEASATSSLRAARVTGQVLADVDPRTGFAPRGFGISDVLLASAVNESVPAARWTSLGAVPLTGPVARRGEFTVVWENYDFGERAASARYSVALALTRNQSLAGRIAANVIGSLASVARIDRQSDRIIVRFDREMPHAAIIPDHIRVDLGETPAGSYSLALEITDTVTGRTATRTMTLLVRE